MIFAQDSSGNYPGSSTGSEGGVLNESSVADGSVSDAVTGNDIVSDTSAADDNSASDSSAESNPVNGSPVEGEPSFRLSENESSKLFFQRLTWDKAQYAVRYSVILERKGTNLDVFTEVLRRNLDATETYLDVSIPAGDYRFRVVSFNILGLLDSQTDWEYFSVLQAFQPSIVDFLPFVFYLDRPSPRIITLSGEYLLPDAEIYLIRQNTVNEAGEPEILRPAQILSNELGESVRLIFNEEDLIAGTYEFYVKNPGGLETRYGVFTIAVAKPYDINVAGGYIPMLTLYGETTYFLDHIFNSLSLSARASFVPFKWSFGNLGAELYPSWSLITSNQNGFRTRANLVLIDVGPVFQYWIIRKELSVNARLGIGKAGIFNNHFEFDNTGSTWAPMNTVGFSFIIGSSVQWFFYKQFFVEGGVDFALVAHPEIPLGFVRFGLFAGYQF